MVAFLSLAFQNPNPPDVALPEGWRVEYALSQNEGRLVGPKGHSIVFAAYGSRGDLAAELRGADRSTIFTDAILDGREVDVAVARDGRLVVSYPRAWPPSHSSFGPFDYRAKVSTSHEAAIDLLVALTRVEAYKGAGYGSYRASDPPSRIAPFFLDYWNGKPFGWLSKPLGYTYRPNSPGTSPAGRLEAVGKPSVEAYLPETPPRTGAYRWEEKRTILGREFHIAEIDRGGLVAWVASGVGVGPVFTTSETSPCAAVTLILTRLSFEKLER